MNKDFITCPTCGRYTGSVKVCKYCDCDMRASSTLKYLRLLSICLGIGGLGMLALMTMARDIPLVKISRINPLMDFAIVCVEGTVERKPYIRNETKNGSCVSFVVADGSGQLRITAYRTVACKLIEKNIIPERGSRIKASGRLSISAGGEAKLVLTSPESMSLVREG